MDTHATTPSQALELFSDLGDLTRFEPDGDVSPQHERRDSPALYQSKSLLECITHLQTPKGAKPVLKTMVTTACERNCHYCPFRAGRGKMKRVTFTPDALAGAFDRLQRAKKVDGLFLSSGIIKGSVTTQDKLLDTVEIVRRKYRYRGYVHLKIMPGIERDQLHRAMQIADRVSVNLEAPTQARLDKLAPMKQFMTELLGMLQLADQIRRDNPHQRLASTVTQFVVGAVGDTDLELLALSEKLYANLRLSRVYYSAFHPIEQTPFESLQAVTPLREHRLYQASFLLRDYGFGLEDLSFTGNENLRQDLDPKQAWAEIHLRHAPIDLQTADREQLLRVPHIGTKSADAILDARARHALVDLSQLRALGIKSPHDLAPYILLSGKRPPQQSQLFPEAG
ncbi:MAG: radical SAM protein [Anaerolineae bacterium]|nr:radical SAM protein [Anaerolineae bacterium]